MKVLITAGPTREALDPMRFISNRSTGKMGYALAAAAVKRGDETTLISGPVSLTPPEGLAAFVPVVSAAEMSAAVKTAAAQADLIIMCAAVADYRPKTVSSAKIKKKDGPMILELERTEDILAALGRSKTPGTRLVGFAAETDDMEQSALDKLRRKNLDWIVANKLNVPGEGAGADTNAVVMFSASGSRTVIPRESKETLAQKILEIVSQP